MKHVYPILLLLTPIFLSAQADLQVSQIQLTSGPFNSAVPNLRTAVEVRVMNADTLPLAAGALFNTTFSGGGAHFSHVDTLEADLAPGAEVAINFGPHNLYVFGPDNGNVEVMAWVNLAADTNASNDTLTSYYFISDGVDNDWSVFDVSVLAPANLNGFDIDNGTNFPPPLSHVRVTLKNNSELTYVLNSPVYYGIGMGDEYFNLAGMLLDECEPGNTSVRNITNQALLPGLPDSVGLYFLCATAEMPNDLYPTNDQGCFSFTIVDNFDPTDPINWPSGFDESGAESVAVRFSEMMLFIKGLSRPSQARLMDLNGRTCWTGTVHDGSATDLRMVGAGIYVIEIEGDKSLHKVILARH